MGIIKRYIRRQSARLLAKLQPSLANLNQEHQFQQPEGGNQKLISCKSSPASPTINSRRRRTRQQAGSGDALLALAAKNHLPPVRFHQVHGPNARLSESRFVARRTQSFCHALVFSDRTIQPNERVYVKVLELAKGWSGTIRFGFTALDPATLAYQMPKHACPDMTNQGHTWARALADEVVRRHSVIHFSYNQQGHIHYGINNQDCGVFQAGAAAHQHLWFVVDVYGLTAAVELVDPRLHRRPAAAKSLADLEALGAAVSSHSGRVKRRRKLPRALGQQHGSYAPAAAAAAAVAVGSQWAPHQQHQQQQLLMVGGQPLGHLNHQLPNLSSALLPAAQQNIYSPMPCLGERTNAATGTATAASNHHDYHQIISSLRHQNPGLLGNHPQQSYQTTRNSALNVSLDESTTSSVNSSSTSGEDDQADGLEQSEQLRRRLEQGLQLADQLDYQHPKSLNVSLNTSSQTLPTPARRTKQQVAARACQTGAKQPTPPGSSSISASSSRQAPQVRARQSRQSKRDITSQVSQQQREKENPPSKDCPICFERPINCVLYQCGHMCTCYECGVKQWRTQSRTCPICRTVIKDVIKTYMS